MKDDSGGLLIDRQEKHIVVGKYWFKNTIAKYGNFLQAGREDVCIAAKSCFHRVKMIGKLGPSSRGGVTRSSVLFKPFVQTDTLFNVALVTLQSSV